MYRLGQKPVAVRPRVRVRLLATNHRRDQEHALCNSICLAKDSDAFGWVFDNVQHVPDVNDSRGSLRSVRPKGWIPAGRLVPQTGKRFDIHSMPTSKVEKSVALSQ